MKEKQKENQLSLAPQEKKVGGNNINKLRQYWFGLDLGCKGTDCVIKWSGEMQRDQGAEALLL